jgi:hypothetical protein
VNLIKEVYKLYSMDKGNKEFLGIVYGFKVYRVTNNYQITYKAFRENNNLLHFKNNDINTLINRIALYDLSLKGLNNNINPVSSFERLYIAFRSEGFTNDDISMIMDITKIKEVI